MEGTSPTYQFDELRKLYNGTHKISQKAVYDVMRKFLLGMRANQLWNKQKALAAFIQAWFKGHDDDGSLLAKAVETAKISEVDERKRSLVELFLAHRNVASMMHERDAEPRQYSRTQSPFWRLILPYFQSPWVLGLEDETDLIELKPGMIPKFASQDYGVERLRIFSILILQGVSVTQSRDFLDASAPEQTDCMESVEKNRPHHSGFLKNDLLFRRGDWPPEDGGQISRAAYDAIKAIEDEIEDRLVAEMEEDEGETEEADEGADKRAEPEDTEEAQEEPKRHTAGGSRKSIGKAHYVVDMTAPPKKKEETNWILLALAGAAAVVLLR